MRQKRSLCTAKPRSCRYYISVVCPMLPMNLTNKGLCCKKGSFLLPPSLFPLAGALCDETCVLEYRLIAIRQNLMVPGMVACIQSQISARGWGTQCIHALCAWCRNNSLKPFMHSATPPHPPGNLLHPIQ